MNLDQGNLIGFAALKICNEASKHRRLTNDENIICCAFQLEDDGLETDGQIVIALGSRKSMRIGLLDSVSDVELRIVLHALKPPTSFSFFSHSSG